MARGQSPFNFVYQLALKVGLSHSHTLDSFIILKRLKEKTRANIMKNNNGNNNSNNNLNKV